MSEHGTSTDVFRQNCANKGSFVVIIKSGKGNVFGAYSGISWARGSLNYKECPSCFIWVLRSNGYIKTKLSLKPVTVNSQFATYQNTKYGPCFGGGFDLCINNPSTSGKSKAHTYWTPSSRPESYFIDGNEQFSISDWEVYLTW